MTKAVRWVDAGEPWPTLANGAKSDPAAASARALGAWLAEDFASRGAPVGSAQGAEMRSRAAAVDRTIGEFFAALSNLKEAPGSSPAGAEAFENLVEVLGGEIDRLKEAAAFGFERAVGLPHVSLRRGLSLEDIRPEGPRGERVKFVRAVAPPPGLALESLAHLRQDVARLKHYGLRDALGRHYRPVPAGVASSYFKVIRPPVTLEGDLGEFKSFSGLANAADAWADEVRAAMLSGFEDHLRARAASSLVAGGLKGDVDAILSALEIERAAADLTGALAHEPEAVPIPGEGLVALVIVAPLPTEGLTR